MKVTKTKFGMLSDGTKVNLYTVKMETCLFPAQIMVVQLQA